MKIQNNGINRLNHSESEGASAIDRSYRTNDAAPAAGSLSGKDKATVSETARLLAKARLLLQEAPDVRTEQVQKLREQIETGNYQPQVEAIVERLFAEFRRGWRS